MFCKQCGAELSSGAKFCPNCGAPTSIEEKTACLNTIQVKCKSCNSVMSVDRDKQVMVCPYCGSHELIIENDAVTIERIKGKTELGRQNVRLKEIQAENDEKKREWKFSAIACTILLIFIIVLWVLLFHLKG